MDQAKMVCPSVVSCILNLGSGKNGLSFCRVLHLEFEAMMMFRVPATASYTCSAAHGGQSRLSGSK
jgi:hypothetical protein